MSLLKKIGLGVVTLAMFVAFPYMLAAPDGESDGGLGRIAQIVAALVVFVGVIAWSSWLGTIFVHWAADLMVDFIYGARGSFVETPMKWHHKKETVDPSRDRSPACPERFSESGPLPEPGHPQRDAPTEHPE